MIWSLYKSLNLSKSFTPVQTPYISFTLSKISTTCIQSIQEWHYRRFFYTCVFRAFDEALIRDEIPSPRLKGALYIDVNVVHEIFWDPPHLRRWQWPLRRWCWRCLAYEAYWLSSWERQALVDLVMIRVVWLLNSLQADQLLCMLNPIPVPEFFNFFKIHWSVPEGKCGFLSLQLSLLLFLYNCIN